MKTKSLIAIIVMAAGILARAQTNDLSAALQKGLFEEEANHNLDAAIQAYQSLAAQFDKDRKLAATAVFRLGECYRKLGKTNEAVVQYQRVVNEFSDQTTLATLSRQNLAGLGSAQQPSLSSSATDQATANAAAAAAEAEAASLKAQIDHLISLSRTDIRIVIQQNYPNPVLTKLAQQSAEAQQNLVRLGQNYGASNSAYITGEKLVETIKGQIDDQVDAVIFGLQSKMAVALDTAKNLRAQVSAPANSSRELSGTTDEEEKEIRRIQTMIQNSPDLINSPAGGTFPLIQAARAGWLRVANFLLDHGAHINVSVDGQTPLHLAADAGHLSMVELLLNHGADVNAKNGPRLGQTPLHLAAQRGFKAVAEVLLAHKADVNAQANDGRTPLHFAAGSSDAIVEMLLSKGADVSAKANGGGTPLQAAAGSGNIAAVKLLLAKGADANAVNQEGRTALSLAAGRGELEILKALLDAKADPNAGTYHFYHLPLLAAIDFVGSVDKTTLCDLLLRHGADPNKVGRFQLQKDILTAGGSLVYSGNTFEASPIQLAAARMQTEVVKLLLDYKANPNALGVQMAPLLIEAVRNRDKATAETLLAHGADVNSRFLYGETALQLAVETGNRELVELLLANKADVNLQINGGQSPLDIARSSASIPQVSELARQSFEKIIGLLREHGAKDLVRLSRIQIRRPSPNFTNVVFQKDTNNWNHFSLMEVILRFLPPFPDFRHIIIHRLDRAMTNDEKQIVVSLLNATNDLDCSTDTWLEFGDIIEIPEREHTLAAQWNGSPDTQDLSQCVGNRNVELVVKGVSTKILIGGGAYLSDQLHNNNITNLFRSALSTSSDLSRVKVKRNDPITGKPVEIMIDETKAIPPNDLWLRNSDVIVVPEKP